MASLPGEFTYGTITGRIITAVKDTAADPDTLPDSVPATGTVTFTPTVGTLVSQTTDTVILLQKISVDLDASGYFTVDLVATSNPNLKPTTFSYVMDVSVPAGQVPSKIISVPAGSVTDIAALYR
jgi:hypothetical protein